MLLLLRRVKHELFMNLEFRKYLAYGFGELLLVVIGILLALQIDNWNEDRKERATLQTYVESIARNMREDLAETEPLLRHRFKALHASTRFENLLNRDSFDVDEIFFLNQVILVSITPHFFSANTSGFEALKVSGVLDRLQGSGMEQLLSRYYDTVNQINRLEKGLSDTIQPISTELRREYPRDLESFAIMNPSALTPDRFQVVQPLFSRIINSPNMGALVDAQYYNQPLMLQYKSLQVLGEAFIRAVEAGNLATAEAGLRTPLDEYVAGLGFPGIIMAGQPAVDNYWLINSQSGGHRQLRFDSVRLHDGALYIDSPGGMDWVSFYWTVINSDATIGRSHGDFSRFSRLQLELKGDQGGEVLKVHVKDADYPDDIAPISVDITLSGDWKTYEIDLAEFAPTDFSRLHVALGFLIFPADEPLAFSVRNAHFR